MDNPSRKRYIMTISDLINAKVDFKGIGDWFTGIYESATTQGSVAGIWDMLDAYLKMIPAVTAIVLLALSFIQVFAGKKLLPLQKFLGAFFVGFLAGAHFIYPMISDFLPLSDLIVGLIVGVVAALICKLVYFLAFILAAGHPVYLLCMTGAISPMFLENMMMSGIAAAVAIVIALIFRKWIEMLGTAVLGGYCVYLSLDALLVALIAGGFDTLLPGYAQIVKIAVIALFGFFGFIVQVKHRRRY